MSVVAHLLEPTGQHRHAAALTVAVVVEVEGRVGIDREVPGTNQKNGELRRGTVERKEG